MSEISEGFKESSRPNQVSYATVYSPLYQLVGGANVILVHVVSSGPSANDPK